MTTESLYSIQFVANITGINPHTIRAWEKRYGATTPSRDKNGRRLYSDSEIRRLEVLNKLVSLGTSISDIANLSEEDLKSVLEKYSVYEVPTKKVKFDINIKDCLNNLLLSLRYFKVDVFAHELEKAEHAMEPLDFIHHLVTPVLEELREMKGRREVTKEQVEQFFYILKSQLHKKMYSINYSHKDTQRKVIVAAASGPLNELGAMVAAIVFLNKRYDVYYLGGNIDPVTLAELSNQIQPRMVFTGLNYSHNLILDKDEKDKYINSLSRHLSEKIKLLVGAFEEGGASQGCQSHKLVDDFDDLESYIEVA